MSNSFIKWVFLLAGLLLSSLGYCLPPFQLFVEITPPGGVLKPPPGVYAGPVVIKRPITIEGRGEVTIDGGGEGTVLSVQTSAGGSVIRGLHITNSGDSHDKVDAGILINADETLIEDNTLDNVLFGIHLKQANENVVRNNRITSREKPLSSIRGEGVRMWYSEGNLIEGNHLISVRDMLFSNSAENRIIGNIIEDSRIGMEFVFSPENLVQGNRITRSTKGIVVIYSNDLEIRDNSISHLREISGSAISIKGSSNALIEHNDILHCAIGVVANAPIHPEHIFHLRNNRFAYNDVAMYFYGDKGGHQITGNRFERNHTDILVSSSSSALDNDWRGNYWDTYEGFDRDHDGFGDQPFTIQIYSDRLWMDRPMTRFFRGSPSLEVYDFVERLAPFSEPEIILRDTTPRMN